ncbi:PKD domain-containing protein [Tellurirhabdus rosea]|uniref:PKD domain-containing protein n=1 Tax=Tellurirhabdus rosea TaxID=2674997 RepID=UPI0022547E05|nr:T9SS type A sorting domain-containing protein [Tellurirhabdus rosea]
MKKLFYLLLLWPYLSGYALERNPLRERSGSHKPAAFDNPAVGFTFTLSAGARTSAGVFGSDGTLLRTLWSNVRFNAGTHTRTWDKKDDLGNLVTRTDYVIKVLSNNVTYTWDGASIGNTSAQQTGSSKFRGFDIIHDAVAVGTSLYYCNNYQEGLTANWKTSTGNTTSTTQILPNGSNNYTSQGSQFVVSDGTYVYWGGSDASHFGVSDSPSYVFATKVSDDTEAIFSSGTAHTANHGRTYQSVINRMVFPISTGIVITGLAVQKTGSYLFVARKDNNTIHVLNKTTGAVVQTLSFTGPERLKINPVNDNELWIMSGGTVKRYTVQTSGTLSAASLTLAGLDSPVAMGISPDGATIVVADAGTSQQLKAFSTANGASAWTFGQQGGYMSNPDVQDAKFYFSDPVRSMRTFITFEPGGSFWVGDPGNYRIQKYSSSRTWQDRIMYLPRSYSIAVDPNNPTRVFNEYLEFAIDYSKSMRDGWRLAKNWRASIPAAYFQDFMANVFKSVTTLSNGRTYALQENVNTHRRHVVELPAAGLPRFTGIELEVYGFESIGPDGSLRYVSGLSNGAQIWYKRTLNGFDAAGNPQWGPAQETARFSGDTGGHPMTRYSEGTPGQTTASGLVISFDRQKEENGHGAGFHLGAIPVGGSDWKWKTALATNREYRGDFPDDGRFDTGNYGSETGNAGGDVQVVENNIFWNYYGEFWKAGQTNKWQHVADNGLMVGQFGVTKWDSAEDSPPQMAGNAFSTSVVKSGSDYYIHHNDEFFHSGVHRWKVSGLNTIQLQTATIVSNPVLPNNGVHLMDGLPFIAPLTDGTAGWVRTPAADVTTNEYSTWWTVKTGVKSYKRDSVDIYAKFLQNSGTATVAKDLGTYTNLPSWKMSGKVSWDGNNGNNGQGGGCYFEVLDNTGKVISRLHMELVWGTVPTIKVFTNNQVIAEGPHTAMYVVTNKTQPFQINAATGGITFRYGTYPAITVPVFDASANWKAPKTVRMYFFGNGSNYARIMGLGSVLFLADAPAPENVTPPAPLLAADDAANTLSASSALGMSEILVSVNGGDYTAYSGQILVGDVSRPAGYWKFKTRAVTGRNESPVAESPAFTLAPVPAAVNQLPYVNAGADQTLALPTSTATLTGTASDSDGSIASYVWSQRSGPTQLTFTNGNSALATVSGIQVGAYLLRLTVTDNQGGTSFAETSLNVQPASLPAIVSFNLINATNGQEIRVIAPGEQLNLLNLPTQNLAIRANISMGTPTGSVVMNLSGAQSRSQTDSNAPFALFGDNNGTYTSWTPVAGSYTLTATPYTAANGTGTAGTPLTISFSVVRPAANPTGNFDKANCSTLEGWAADRNQLNTSVNVDVVIDGVLVATVPANRLRSDVGAALRDNGLHGFRFNVPSAYQQRGTHTASIRLAGTSYVLPNSPRQYTCATSARMDTSGEKSGGEVSATAWLLFPNPVQNSLTIAVPAPFMPGNLQMTIVSSTGRQFAVPAQLMAADNQQITVDVQGLQLLPGVYFIQISDGQRLLQTIRFVKS